MALLRDPKLPPSARLVAFALTALVGWYASDLPDVDSIEQMTRRPSIRLVSADGVQLASYGDFYGKRKKAEECWHLTNRILRKYGFKRRR